MQVKHFYLLWICVVVCLCLVFFFLEYDQKILEVVRVRPCAAIHHNRRRMDVHRHRNRLHHLLMLGDIYIFNFIGRQKKKINHILFIKYLMCVCFCSRSNYF